MASPPSASSLSSLARPRETKVSLRAARNLRYLSKRSSRAVEVVDSTCARLRAAKAAFRLDSKRVNSFLTLSRVVAEKVFTS